MPAKQRQPLTRRKLGTSQIFDDRIMHDVGRPKHALKQLSNTQPRGSLVPLLKRSNFFAMPHKNVGQEVAGIKDRHRTLDRSRMPHQRRVTLGSSKRRAKKTEQI